MQKPVSRRHYILGEVVDKSVGFKGEIALVVDIRKRLCDILPVEVIEERRTMQIVLIVVVVNMETADIIVTECSQHIGRSCADKSCVTYINAGGEILGIKHFHHLTKFIAETADIRNDTISATVPAEHILTGNLDVILLAKRNKSIVKLCVQLQISLTVIYEVGRVDNNILHAEDTCDLNGSFYPFEDNLVICIVPYTIAWKRCVSLIEKLAVALDNFFQLKNIASVIRCIENCVVITQAKH